MVGEYGEVLVMDWGLAQVLGERDPADVGLLPDGAGGPTGRPLRVRDA